MTEIKLTVEAPAIVEALNRIAALLERPQTTPNTAFPASEPAAPVMGAVPVVPSAPAAAPVAPVVPTPPISAAPIVAPVAQPAEYTLQQLSLAATPLMDAGKQAQLIATLQKYGVAALTQLPKEQYGAFAADLRAMGARI